MDDDAIWYRLEVLVGDGESGALWLWDIGASGVEVQDRDTYMEDGAIAPVPEGRTRLIAYFEEGVTNANGVAEALAGLDPEIISWARFDDRSWETAWMDYFRPLALSPRAMVGPPWEEFAAPEGGVKLVIEPGMAFGTGTHETTQLCAAALDARLAAGDAPRVLDVGCGSAILSMLAHGLGAGEVVGIDHDETAVEVARENLAVNAMEGAIALSTTPLASVEGGYEVVIANILAHILEGLRDELVDHVSPGGMLLLSGVTTEQEERFRERFEGPELELAERNARGEWVALSYRRR